MKNKTLHDLLLSDGQITKPNHARREGGSPLIKLIYNKRVLNVFDIEITTNSHINNYTTYANTYTNLGYTTSIRINYTTNDDFVYITYLNNLEQTKEFLIYDDSEAMKVLYLNE